MHTIIFKLFYLYPLFEFLFVRIRGVHLIYEMYECVVCWMKGEREVRPCWEWMMKDADDAREVISLSLCFFWGGGFQSYAYYKWRTKQEHVKSVNYQALSGRYTILINARGSYQNRRRDTLTISTKIRLCLIPLAFNQRFGWTGHDMDIIWSWFINFVLLFHHTVCCTNLFSAQNIQ